MRHAARDSRHGGGDETDGPVEVGFVAAGRVPCAERRSEPGLKDALMPSSRSAVKKSHARIAWAWERRN